MVFVTEIGIRFSFSTQFFPKSGTGLQFVSIDGSLRLSINFSRNIPQKNSHIIGLYYYLIQLVVQCIFVLI